MVRVGALESRLGNVRITQLKTLFKHTLRLPVIWLRIIPNHRYSEVAEGLSWVGPRWQGGGQGGKQGRARI
jgi:hypothetical protein